MRTLLQDSDGHLWFGTDGAGLCRYDGQQFTTFGAADGLPYGVISALLEDRNGNLWIGTEGGGVSCYDGARFTTYRDGLASDYVASLLEDRDGNIWIGTQGGGVTKFDGHRFTTFTKLDGLVHDWVGAILEDREGNLWFGTLGAVTLYDGESFFLFQRGWRTPRLGRITAVGRSRQPVDRHRRGRRVQVRR